MRATKCNSVLMTLMGIVSVAAIVSQPQPVAPEAGTVRGEPALVVPRVQVVEGAFKPNATLVATLVDLDVPRDLAHNIARLIQPVFDVRSFRSGNNFKLEKDKDGTVRAFEYKINEEKILEVQREADSWAARI